MRATAPTDEQYATAMRVVTTFIKDVIDRVTPLGLAEAAEVDDPELIGVLIDKATVELDVQWNTDEEGVLL